MSANKENNLVQAYSELNKFCVGGDYDRALKATGKILQIAPNEQKAFHCKIVCFIQLGNFKEALNVLIKPKHAPLGADLYFEKAYVQYRLNCPKDALETVDSAPEQTPALKELRAQILYRLEQYQDCYNLYRDLVKNTTDDYEDERQANMAAVVANLAAVNPSSDLPQFEESTYELTYNAGTTTAMRGKYNEALQQLKKAEQACSESVIDDGGTEEEAKQEAAIIRVQQAYCLQQMGKEKEAAAIYHNVLKDRPSDQALIAVASNNAVVINRFAASAEGLEHKLNSRQRAAIAYNQAILAIYSNQPDFCKQCCVKLAREFNEARRAALVEASSLMKEGKKAQAGDRKGAVKLLEESEYKYRPGVVGALCTLLAADNEHERASLLFLDVYEHYKNDEILLEESEYKYRPGVVGALCTLLAADNEHERASLLFLDVYGHYKNDEILLEESEYKYRTGVVGALCTLLAADNEHKRASLLFLDVYEHYKNDEVRLITPGSELGQKKKPARKRKTKLPPNADVSRPPDPESDMSKQQPSAAAAAKSPRPVETSTKQESAWQRKQQQKKKGKGRKW
ncbi:Signal recognition particle subunit SRP72 [Operophtera brumata]|uniref:Signal recognition particle subunit SRP72 n=1 Tax=Operophtera brumata TaxID=104452 RepID=A0A0L7KYN8_OPEBR|nr:Signal recognition particle subunit SRP72 [Operophtera brumata]